LWPNRAEQLLALRGVTEMAASVVMLSISPATESGFQMAKALMLENMGSYHETHNIPWDPDWVDLNYRDKDNYSLYLGTAWVGFVSLEWLETSVFVHTLQIQPADQGLGLGNQVFQWLRTQAARRGMQRIGCRSFRDNPALELYRRLGFAVVEEQGALVEMELKLTLKPEGDYSE